MEDYPHAFHRNQASATFSKKISHGNGFTSKTVYDDVFGGPPKFGVPTFSSRIEDYTEIFGSFRSSRGSSIPVLDLPVPGAVDISVDDRASKLDYLEIFGGLNGGVDFFDSHEDLFVESKGGESSSEEAWTLAGRGSPSEGPNADTLACSENNLFMSDGVANNKVDGVKQINVSNHETVQRSEEDGTNGTMHITQHPAVPEVMFVVDGSTPPQKTEVLKMSPRGVNDVSGNTDSSRVTVEEKNLKKTMSLPPMFTRTSESDFKRQNRSRGNGSSSNNIFVTVSEISLRTLPSQVPPPMKPPPKLSIKQGNSKIASEKHGLEGATSDSSAHFFDVEVDASSAAAASAAAMKEVMEKAQARLKSAKESMERKRDGLQSRLKLGLKDDLSSRARKEHIKAPHEALRFGGDVSQETSKRMDGGMKGFGRQEGQHGISTAQVAPDFEGREKHLNVGKEFAEQKVMKEPKSAQESHIHKEGRHDISTAQVAPDFEGREKHLNVGKEFAEQKVMKEPKSAQESYFHKEAGEWKVEKQFYEPEKTGKSKAAPKVLEQAKIEKKLMSPIITQEHEEVEKVPAKRVFEHGEESGKKSKESEGACEQEKPRKLIEATKEAHELKKQEEKLKVAQERSECEGNEKKLKVAQEISKHEDDEKKLKVAQEISKHEEDEKKLKVACELEGHGKKLEEAHEQKENEKKLEEARQWEETEKRCREAYWREGSERRLKYDDEQEENGKKLKESCNREENEKRLIDSSEQEESEKKLKEACEWEFNGTRTQEVHEKEENDKRQKEACEQEENEKKLKVSSSREENEKRLKDSSEQEESEKKLKEAYEWEFNGRRLQEVHEKEEHDKRQKEAHEGKENDKKLNEACEKEENEKRLQEAHEHEESEKRLKQAFEQEDNEKRLKDDHKQKESENRPDEVCKMEDNENKLKGVFELVENQKRREGNEGENNENRQKQSCEGEENENKVKADQEAHDLKVDQSLMATSVSCMPVNNNNIEANQEGPEHEENNGKLKMTWEAIEHEGNGRIPEAAKDACESEGNGKELKIAKAGNEEDVSGRSEPANVVQCSPEQDRFVHIKLSMEGLSLEEHENESGESEIAIALEQNEKNTRTLPVACDQESLGKSQVASDQEVYQEKNEAAEGVKNWVENGKKTGVAQSVMSFDEKGNLQIAQQVSKIQNTERKDRNNHETCSNVEREKEVRLQRERELEEQHLRKIEEEKEREREREREKNRMAVERATREARERAFAEARERAERAAVERATAEVRQRAMTEAREKLEKASAEAREKSLAEKAFMEARLRAERAAVERATAEARERAAEKAALDARGRAEKTSECAERSVADKFYRANSRDYGMRQNSGSDSSSRHTNSSVHGASYTSVKFQGTEGESAQRCKARLERHQRTVERAAKALAEKNTRDLLAQREQAERNRLAETLDADVRRWSSGKEGNLRALLSTLQYILGPDSGWQPIPLTEVITAVAVKKAYRKATLCVHPDKLQQRGASIQQKYICEKVFDLLKEAWNKFNSEER